MHRKCVRIPHTEHMTDGTVTERVNQNTAKWLARVRSRKLNYRRRRVAGEGRIASLPCADCGGGEGEAGNQESCRTWSIHLLRGWPAGRRFQPVTWQTTNRGYWGVDLNTKCLMGRNVQCRQAGLYVSKNSKAEQCMVWKQYKKLIRRWDSERELSLRRHCTRTKNTIDLHKFRHRSLSATQVY